MSDVRDHRGRGFVVTIQLCTWARACQHSPVCGDNVIHGVADEAREEPAERRELWEGRLECVGDAKDRVALDQVPA